MMFLCHAYICVLRERHCSWMQQHISMTMCDHYGNMPVFSVNLDDVKWDVLKGDQQTSVKMTNEAHACMHAHTLAIHPYGEMAKKYCLDLQMLSPDRRRTVRKLCSCLSEEP